MTTGALSSEWTKQTGRIWANLRRVDPNPIITLPELRQWLYDRRWRQTMLWQCAYCRKILGLPRISLDHWKPRTRGGPSTEENLVECCEVCNRLKGPMTERQAYEFFMWFRTLDAVAQAHVRKLGAKPAFRYTQERKTSRVSYLSRKRA